MNKYIILLFSLVCTTLFSCYDDLGNYDYKEINELEISGLGENIQAIYKNDTIKITPVVTSSLAISDTTRYSYEWKAVNATVGKTDTYIIGTELNLNYYVELLPGNYELYLKIRDKKTDLLWMKNVVLNVTTQVARGFIILGEDAEGFAAVDMISMANDTILLKNLIKDNGLPRLKNPVRIQYTGASSASMSKYVRLWLMTEDGSYNLDTKTMLSSTDNTFRKLVYTSFDIPSEINPVYMLSKTITGAMSTNRYIICDDGNLYKASLFNGDYYSNPYNRLSTVSDVLFTTYPYIFTSPKYYSNILVYDMDNQRFVKIGSFDTMGTALADKAGDIFPWDQKETERTLHYAENTMNTDGGSSNGNSFALMKDKNADYFIYKFYGYNSGKRGAYAVDKTIAQAIDQASLFGFASLRTIMVYAVDNKLYAYDYNPGNEKLYVKEFDDEITMVKFDIESSTSYNQLFVATYNATTGGKLEQFTIGDNQNTFELVPTPNCTWNGLVKIKHIEWRNSEV